MRKYFVLVGSALLLGVPGPLFANVHITEVAWMGTDEGGANCEWIELHNDSDEVVSLAGWTLTVGASTLDLGSANNVVYSGIAEHGYYLIARSTGACATLSPGSSADWKGTFTLANDGAKLVLKHGVDEEDAVDASAGWAASGIGGNNTAPKQTAQKTGAGWITAPPTPRGPNHEAPLLELPEEEGAGTSTPVVTIGGTAPLVPVAHPVPKLLLSPVVSRIVTTGADTPYEVMVYDSTGKVRTDADVSWSFGDGGHESGDSVTHMYRNTGAYTGVVRARARGSSVVSTFTVDVAPATLTLTPTEDGIIISNDTPRLVDLSSWKLTASGKKFKLPQDTVIEAHQSTLLPSDITGLGAGEPALLYPSGKVAAAYAPPSVAGTSTIVSETRHVGMLKPIPPPEAAPGPADPMSTAVAPADGLFTVLVRSVVSWMSL